MLNGAMLVWFALTALSLLFVIIDVRTTPASLVLKWGFVLLTAYTGPLGAFLYVLGCREPLPGLHERYIVTRWRQVLGSTMHCVAGDGVGILAGSVIASLFHLPKVTDIALEYALGFGFGWSIFQALFMRDMVGGSYTRSLSNLFSGTLVHELSYGRHGAHDDIGDEKRSGESRSDWTGILVCHVHGPSCRFHYCLSHELVAGIPKHEAWHVDCAATGRVCRQWRKAGNASRPHFRRAC